MNIPQIIKIAGIVESIALIDLGLEITLKSDSFTGGSITVAVDVESMQTTTIKAGDRVEVDFVERTVKLI